MKVGQQRNHQVSKIERVGALPLANHLLWPASLELPSRPVALSALTTHIINKILTRNLLYRRTILDRDRLVIDNRECSSPDSIPIENSTCAFAISLASFCACAQASPTAKNASRSNYAMACVLDQELSNRPTLLAPTLLLKLQPVKLLQR